MIFKDYYKILGLNTNRVTIQEIKTAYKEQAKKYHPDLNGGGVKYEERFKDINESYKVLSDPSSKRKYDRIWCSNIGKKNKVGRKVPNSNKEAIIGMFFGNANENVFSKNKKNEIRGENIETEINISLEEALLGGNKTLGIKTVSGKLKTYEIEIPKGIQNHENIRLVGQGKAGLNGGKNGDLIIKVNINDMQDFRLEGYDIKSDLLLTPWEAALGKKIKLETLEDEVTIFVPEGTQCGDKFVIEGKGYPDISGDRGNLVLEAKIVVPKNLDEKQKECFKKMQEIMDYNPRKK